VPAAARHPRPTVDLTLDPEAINFWSRDSAEGLVTPLVESWNASHPTKIKATFIPGDQFVQKFATALAGGEAPDLVAVDLIYMPAYAAAEQMTDLTDQAKALPFFDQLSPSHVRLGTTMSASTPCRSTPKARCWCTTRTCSGRLA
jgi:ABC-type glycerol-3-phosphate transport system substrate-binding protein